MEKIKCMVLSSFTEEDQPRVKEILDKMPIETFKVVKGDSHEIAAIDDKIVNIIKKQLLINY